LPRETLIKLSAFHSQAMMTGFEQYTRKMRRALFLEEMGQVVPWRELCGLLDRIIPSRGTGGAGHKSLSARRTLDTLKVNAPHLGWWNRLPAFRAYCIKGFVAHE
jgi:hypothetical protein